MKNLKKVALLSFAVVAVVAISLFNTNAASTVASNQDEVSASNVQLASVIDWSDYDFNSSTETEKCGSGKCGDDKKKSESTKKSEKCGGEKASKEKKSDKCGGEKSTKEKKSEKCGTGKCGKA